MKFGDLTSAQARLRIQALQKEAELQKEALVGKLIGAPFRALGWGAGKALKGTGKAMAAPVKAGLKAGYRGSVRESGKILGPLMFAGGLAGMAGVAGSSIGKAREYNRGFDPRLQAAALRRVG